MTLRHVLARHRAVVALLLAHFKTSSNVSVRAR